MLIHIAADTVLEVAERALSLSDHFAVTGAFEICADRCSTDARFEKVGTKLLEQLLGDIEQA